MSATVGYLMTMSVAWPNLWREVTRVLFNQSPKRMGSENEYAAEVGRYWKASIAVHGEKPVPGALLAAQIPRVPACVLGEISANGRLSHGHDLVYCWMVEWLNWNLNDI